ncbi:MAG: aminotransferase class III-fold pyridoxal phosphate-dependent enzyme, partial [bacterium]
YTEPQITLAEKLLKASFPGRVFLCNSGAEANECAFKLARRWGEKRKARVIVSFANSFHGRTLAALAATGQRRFSRGFEPMPPAFRWTRFNDDKAIKWAIRRDTCGVIVEPIQGEGGVNPATPGFLRALRRRCDQVGALLIFDEVQTGMGRTGKMFAFQTYGVRPDVVTLAKGLGGGVPIGAIIARSDVAKMFGPGDHGSTFGGNPLSSAAAVAALGTLTPARLAHIRRVGGYLGERLRKLAGRVKCIKEVRGMGLMWGMELYHEGAPVVAKCLARGLLINCTQDTVLRLLPPYTITPRDVDRALRILEVSLQHV